MALRGVMITDAEDHIVKVYHRNLEIIDYRENFGARIPKPRRETTPLRKKTKYMNSRAIRFYRKHGFAHFGRRGGTYLAFYAARGAGSTRIKKA